MPMMPMMPPGPGAPPMPPPGLAGGPPSPMGMQPPPPQGFPSLDPQMIAQTAQPVAALQAQDLQQFQDAQNTILGMVLKMMQSQPNPAGQAAMTLPAPPQDQSLAPPTGAPTPGLGGQ